MEWPEWIACQRYTIPGELPSSEMLHAAILAELNPAYPKPDGFGVMVEKVVLERRWYSSTELFIPTAEERHERIARIALTPGYRCPLCKTTFFEITPALVMQHDCNAEAIRFKLLDEEL